MIVQFSAMEIASTVELNRQAEVRLLVITFSWEIWLCDKQMT